MVLVGDMESNGLKFEVNKIHCIINKDIETKKWYLSFKDINFDIIPILNELLEKYKVFKDHSQHLIFMSSAKNLVYHNGFGCDYFIFKKLYHNWVMSNVDDTFVLSCLFDPDKRGGHSLGELGKSFGIQKEGMKIVDWSKFTPLMLRRCISDVKITELLFNSLNTTRFQYDWESSIRLEYGVAYLHAKQEFNGIPFDLDLGKRVHNDICKEINSLDITILSGIPKRATNPYSIEIKKPFLMTGGFSKAVHNWFNLSDELTRANICGPFTRIEWTEINLNSSKQSKDYLLKCGWKPTTWNYKKNKSGGWEYDKYRKRIKTSPKLTEDSFGSVTGIIPQLFAKRNILKHRKSQLLNSEKNTGLLTLVRNDGRISAEANPHATPTARYRHYKVVNIPTSSKDEKTGELIWYPNKQRVVYGTEFRAMFCSVPGFKLVGNDAKGLEARIEAHYCYEHEGGREYAKELMEGDVHSKNAIFFGTSRDDAKAPKYALTYGAQPPLLAEMLGCSLSKAKGMFNAFWKGNTALNAFKEECEAVYNKRSGKRGGWLVGLDGRKLFIRSLHSLVNIKFQSAGSICVKAAMCLLWNKWIPQSNVEAYLVIQQHDEWQALVRDDCVDEYSKLALNTFPVVGKFFNLNVPLEGDIKVGENWAMTH